MFESQQNISEETANDIKKVAKGAGISFIGSVAGRGLWLVCQIIIARTIGPEVFGLYILGLVVTKIAGELSRLGLQGGALRFVSIHRRVEPGKVKGTIISATLISFIVGTFMGCIVYVFAGNISENIFHNPALTDIIKAFTICIPFLSTMMVIAKVSQGFHTTKYSVTIVHIIQPSANILCVVIFILLGFGISGIVYAYIISHVFALFLGLFFVNRQFPGIRDKTLKPVYETKKLLKYSTPLLVSGLLIFLISWIDVLMLGIIKSSVEVGIYRAASQIPLLLVMILNASGSIYAPAIAELHHNNQTKRLEKLLKTSTYWVFLLSLPAALILFFSARDILAIFGSAYVGVGASIMIVLTIAQSVNCITGGVSHNLTMTGKQNIELINNIAMVVINIILNYFLISTYGAIGAAIATGISIGTVNLIRLLEVYIIYKIHPYNKSYISGIICGLISIIILHLLDVYIPDRSYMISFISNVLVVVLVFVIPFVIMKPSDEDKLLFVTIGNKFKFKKVYPEI